MKSSSLARLAAGAVVAAWLLVPLSGLVAQTPKFKAGIAVVPLDVRVVDGKGNPVNDLTRADFVVKEDGVPQEITHFERQSLTPGTPPTEHEMLVPKAPVSADLRVQNRRVFFIQLGRQWLPLNVFGLTGAVARFLRERLLPQDYAVVSAFGRITDLTTDHEALAQVVERLDALQRSLEAGPDQTIKVRAMYRLNAQNGQKDDEDVRLALDAVFAPASAGTHLASRSTSGFETLLASIQKGVWSESKNDAATNLMIGVTSSHALDMLTPVRYLRFIDGEKHLIYFAPGAIRLPSADDDRSIARIASDARVAIHIIRSDGLAATAGGKHPSEALLPEMESRNIAALTGGQAYIDKYPDQAFAKIEALTRVGYLLAYSPAKPEADGRHRKISISVTRPRGATVIARESYLATDKPATYDDHQFAVQDRIMTVAETAGAVTDLGVQLTATSRAKSVDVDVAIDFSQVKATGGDGRHIAKLEVVVFCTDAKERLVGQRWMTLDLKLKDETFVRAMAEGFHHAAAIPVSGDAQFVKVVVYDYATDRAGSAVVRLR